jgi:hypothetical protein
MIVMVALAMQIKGRHESNHGNIIVRTRHTGNHAWHDNAPGRGMRPGHREHLPCPAAGAEQTWVGINYKATEKLTLLGADYHLKQDLREYWLR